MSHAISAERLSQWRAASRVLLVATLTLFLLPGCSILKTGQQKRRAAAQKKAVPRAKLFQMVGTIALVSSDGEFVLIDNESRPSPAIGTLVQTRPTGATPAQMRVTEIRKRPFVIADIVSGNPQKGETVFQ